MPHFGENIAVSCAALNIASKPQEASCDDAFTALVHRQSKFVFRVAFSVLRNVQDAEDTTQETFLKLYRLNQWREIKDERAFLARAAWRLAVGRLKAATSPDLAFDRADPPPSAEASLIQDDADSFLHRLINALPPELRLPLALSTIDEMTSPAIAKVMSIPEGTVRTRLQRAREILKRKLIESEVRHG